MYICTYCVVNLVYMFICCFKLKHARKKIFKRRILGNRWRRKINISLIFFFLSVSLFHFHLVKKLRQIRIHTCIYIHMYTRARIGPNTVAAKQQKNQYPKFKKKKRYVQLKQIHCIVLLLLSRLLDYKYFACTISNCVSFLITL